MGESEKLTPQQMASDAKWDRAKNDGHDPAGQPRFSAIAGLRELATELLINAENAGGGD